MASKSGKTGAKPPISAHRAFPAIVALWFAALFGLGSLVLPVALFEGLVNATGISSVISAAEPPLGATTRIIIAILAAGLGVALGLFLARKVAASNAPEPVRQRAATLDQAADQAAEREVPQAKRPISAHEELGSEFLDDPVDEDDFDDVDEGFQRSPHRRALAMSDESAPSEFLSDAPVPGDGPGNGGDSSGDRYENDAHPGFNGLAETTADAAREFTADTFEETVDDTGEDLLELGTFADDEAGAPLALEEPQVQPLTQLPPAPDTELEEAPSMTLENDQDTRETATGYNPFAAQAAAMPEPAARPFAAPQTQAETPVEDEAVEADESPVVSESLAELSMPELVERFSRALEARTQQNDTVGKDPLVTDSNEPDLILPSFAAKSAVPSVAPVVVDAPLEMPAAQREEASEEAPVATSAVPFALQPIAADEDDSDDEAENADNGLTLNLNNAMPRQFARPDAAEPAPAAQSDQPAMPVPFEERVAAMSASALQADDLDDDDLEEGYSSLLAMKSPIASGREFVRIEDEVGEAEKNDSAAEPVVVFPGQEQRSAAPTAHFSARGPSTAAATATASAPDDRPFAPPTEARTAPSGAYVQPGSESEVALREALEKLQKLSGAG